MPHKDIPVRILKNPSYSWLNERRKEYEKRGIECTFVYKSATKGLYCLGYWERPETKPKPQYMSLKELYEENK